MSSSTELPKSEVARFLFALCKAIPRFAPDFSDQATLEIWYRELKVYTSQKLKEAFRIALTTEEAFPPLSRLKRLLETSSCASDEEIGIEVAARIESSFAKSPSRRDEYVGEIGQRVVELCGGWGRLSDLTNDQLPSARKQWRELAQLVSKRAREGNLNSPPSLPSPAISPVLSEALAITERKH